MKWLEKECENSVEGGLEGEKERAVELSEIKESLKMTKEVN
jgi:hypothetical protein